MIRPLFAGKRCAGRVKFDAGLTQIKPTSVASARPGCAYQILFLAVVQGQGALAGVVDVLGDSAREVRVGGRHQDSAVGVLDRDDSLQRVAGFLARLAVAHQVEDLIAVGGEVVADQAHVARGVAVADALAGGAQLLVHGAGRRAVPGPASLLEEGAAFRAARRIRELASGLVAVVPRIVGQLLAARQAGGTIAFHDGASCSARPARRRFALSRETRETSSSWRRSESKASRRAR